VPAGREQLVGDLLLLGRERRVEWLGDCERFGHPRGRRRKALLPALHALDRRGTRALFAPCSTLGAQLLHPLVGLARMLAQRRGEGIPLGLLGVGDLQLGLQAGESRLDALAGQPKLALPVMLPLRVMACLLPFGAAQGRPLAAGTARLRKDRGGGCRDKRGGNERAQDGLLHDDSSSRVDDGIGLRPCGGSCIRTGAKICPFRPAV